MTEQIERCVNLQLFDNTGAAVVGVQITVTLNGTSVTTVEVLNEVIDVNLTVPADARVGFMI